MNQILSTGNSKNNSNEDIEDGVNLEDIGYDEELYDEYDEIEDFTPSKEYNEEEDNDSYDDYEIESDEEDDDSEIDNNIDNYDNEDSYSNDYKDDNNYNNYSNDYNAYSSDEGRTDNKAIVKIFAIAIIIFALAIIGIVAYKFVDNTSIQNSEPEVTMEQIEGNVNLSAKNKKGISKLVYYWDENDKTEIDNTGESVSKLITIPKGINTLTVIVYDASGVSKEYSKVFEYSKDKEKPKIELSIKEDDASLKIIATDETEIAYISYQWNDDEIEKIYPEETEAKKIEGNIEIKRGKNTLKIIAADTSNNIVEEEKIFNGVNEPEIDFYVKEGYIYITVTHDLGIKEIIYTINGEEFIFDDTTEGYEEEKLSVIRKKRLIEGENTVEITAKSVEDTSSTRRGKYTYTPAE